MSEPENMLKSDSDSQKHSARK